jgi:hypothetical protein
LSRITLNKLIVHGVSYRRTIHFNEDFTIISGEKTSGKSLILSLIDYCFGKSNKIDLSVQTELDTYCDQVFLELRINDEILTLNRMLKEKQSKISIYFCPFEKLDEYTPKISDIKEAMQIIMQKLNVNEYKMIRYQKHSNKKEIDTVSFRDLFRFVYIHQHSLGTGDFLEKKNTFKSNKNPYAFKMMFNLVDVDKDTLTEQLVKIQNDIETTRREITGLNSYLKDLDAEDLIVLQAKSERFNAEIEYQKSAKSSIILKSKTSKKDINENKMYIKLKKDLEEISNEMFDYQREKRHTQLSISSKKFLLEDYKTELKEVEETLELNYKLVIPAQSIECPLCSSKVPNHLHNSSQNINTEKNLQKVKKEILNKITLVSELITYEETRVVEFDKQLTQISRKQIILNEAISEFAKQTDVPFLSEIDSISSILNRITKEHEMVKECLRIHHKVNEKVKHIEELKASETKLKDDLSKLQISDDKKVEVFNFLNTEYKGFMKRLKYNIKGETYIHNEHFIPYYNGASVYAHESGGLLECMQLSYLGAILNSKTEGYAPGHPGFLMLDSLSKYVGTLKKGDLLQGNSKDEIIKPVDDMNSKENNKIHDPEVYEEFYKILVELSENNQIILVENTPLEQFDSLYTKYTFYEGEKGFIDKEKNELHDNLDINFTNNY